MSAELDEALAFIRRRGVIERETARAWWRQRRARLWADHGMDRPSDVDRAIKSFAAATHEAAKAVQDQYDRLFAMFADPKREEVDA